jgi:uncharacterized membrane protein
MNNEIRYLAQHLLHAGVSPLSERDRRVIQRVARRTYVARNLNQVFDQRSTFGQRLADRVAVVGGSWTFIAGFGVFLALWAGLNVAILAESAFDPYPFVFLNLLLSMLAALQAPIIMMSQNRQAAKDRLAAALDYEVNVKSETAISELHDKMDRLTAQIEQLAAPKAPAAAPVRGEAEPGRPALRVA